MKIDANALIDTLVYEFNDIETRYRDIPKDAYIHEGSEYKKLVEKCWAAESRLNLVSEIMGVSWNCLYDIVLTGRRWYTKTNWQKVLPMADAERLVDCMIRHHSRG